MNHHHHHRTAAAAAARGGRGGGGGARMLWSRSSSLHSSVAVVFIAIQLLQLFAMVPGAAAEVFAVGGAAGWTVPHKGVVNYTEWAAMLTSLNVGDTLLFTYPVGEHNVVQVGEEDFGRCRSTNPIATFTDGQTLVNLPKEGQYWFICGFSGHCKLGQKFVISVFAMPASRAPAPSPAAAITPPTPPGVAPAGNDGSGTGTGSASPDGGMGISPGPSAVPPSSKAPPRDTLVPRAQHLALVVVSLISAAFRGIWW